MDIETTRKRYEAATRRRALKALALWEQGYRTEVIAKKIGVNNRQRVHQLRVQGQKIRAAEGAQ